MGARRVARRAAVVAAALLLAARAGVARAQLPVLLEGLADGELWSTTTRSNLLTRNGGRPAELGRVQLWGAIEPLSRLVFYGQGQVEGGRARTDSERVEVYAEQYGVRYAAAAAFVVDAGKLAPVLGTFAPRHFSNRNPLIGVPDGYSLDYPLGVEVSGEMRHFDYRAAMVSLPASHDNYVPPTTKRLRPAVGVGVTPVVGLRIGGSFTIGPYLNRSFTPQELFGRPWTHYQQRVVAADLAFARGYLETHAEAARASYDVPGRADPLIGFTYYGEAKYTFTPRVFVAARAERNNYPFIRAFGTTWAARTPDFVDGELGVGYRATATTLVKASVRADRWWVPANATAYKGQGGPAVAMQVSQSFDVVSWFDRRR